MRPYIERLIDPHIERLFEQLPALSLVGPRACGKTTTALRYAKTFVRCDDPNEAAAFAADPAAALAASVEPILLDEWQEVPGLLGAIKRSVDADFSPGRFILTGSIRAQLDQRHGPERAESSTSTCFRSFTPSGWGANIGR